MYGRKMKQRSSLLDYLHSYIISFQCHFNSTFQLSVLHSCLKDMKTTIITIAILICLSACNDNSDCSDVACTEEFISVTVQVLNQSNEAVALNRTESVLDDGTILETDLPIQIGTEVYYVVANDNHMDLLPDDSNVVTFTGWIDNQVVVTQQYIISKDCCHIDRQEGPELITID